MMNDLIGSEHDGHVDFWNHSPTDAPPLDILEDGSPATTDAVDASFGSEQSAADTENLEQTDGAFKLVSADDLAAQIAAHNQFVKAFDAAQEDFVAKAASFNQTHPGIPSVFDGCLQCTFWRKFLALLRELGYDTSSAYYPYFLKRELSAEQALVFKTMFDLEFASPTIPAAHLPLLKGQSCEIFPPTGNAKMFFISTRHSWGIKLRNSRDNAKKAAKKAAKPKEAKKET